MCPSAPFLLAEQHPEHAPEKPELNEPRGKGEKQTEDDQYRDESPPPGHVPDGVENSLYKFHDPLL